MDSKDIFKAILPIIENEFHEYGKKITMSTDFDKDLGADKLGLREMILQIEEHFKFRASIKALKPIQTVGDLVKYIKRIV